MSAHGREHHEITIASLGSIVIVFVLMLIGSSLADALVAMVAR